MSISVNILTLFAVAGILLISRRKNPKKIENKYSDVKLEPIDGRMVPEEGFIDVVLKIVTEINEPNVVHYTVKGLYKNKIVALQLDVRQHIEAGLQDNAPNGKGFLANGVTFRSLGQESDRFIKAMAELYGQPEPRAFRKQPVSTMVFSLNEATADLNQKDIYRLKLFFEEEDRYAELYLHIDTERSEIWLNEKDMEYRTAVIQSLSM